MTKAPSPRQTYLEQLRDLLPARDAARVLPEIEGLLLDRVEGEMAERGISAEEAEQRAVAALGPPEALAEGLTDRTLRIALGTRRAFTRLLAVVFAVHVLLSVVLTAAGSTEAPIPGLLGPLPTGPLGAVFSSVLSILLLDAGALLLLFALLGPARAPAVLPAITLVQPTSRRDAALSLLLLALVVLILHPFRDQIFVVATGEGRAPILTPEILSALPLVDVALLLVAARQVLLLATGRENALGAAVDAAGSLVLAAAFVVAATQGDLVRFPEGALGRQGADLLSDLVTRVFLLVFVGAALFLIVRFVKRALRARQLLAR